MKYHKPTYLWTNIESLIADANSPFNFRRCSASNPCPYRDSAGHFESLGRGSTSVSEAAAYPHELVVWLKSHIDAAIAHRRRDKVAAHGVATYRSQFS